MNDFILFGLLSIPVLIISWRSVLSFKNHGFYRFFSWEAILWLAVRNYPVWFKNFLSANQIVSWIFLFTATYLVLAGVFSLKNAGKRDSGREENALFKFEKTAELVESGIYKYIRHPLYSSLLFLGWGIFFKNPGIETGIVSGLMTVFLYFTAFFDEKECIHYFGEKYSNYMKRTKMFIPFLF